MLIAAKSADGQDAEARADLQQFLATPRTWNAMAEIQKFPYFAADAKLLEGRRDARRVGTLKATAVQSGMRVHQ